MTFHVWSHVSPISDAMFSNASHQAELVVLRGHDFCAGSLLERKDSVRVFFLAFLDFCAFLRAKLFFLKRTASRNKPVGISAAVPTGTDQKADS